MGLVGVAVTNTFAAAAGALDVTLQKRSGESQSDGQGFSLDVRFLLSPGLTVLFGASGAGKTTILDCIAGLQKPDSGRVAVGATSLFASSMRIDVPTRERHVGYLFQTLALFPHMTGRQNIEYGLASLTSDERARRVTEVAESFAIAQVLERRPSQASGGERQRIALARALVTRPRALLLDEPMTALDAVTKSKIIDDLRRWMVAHAIPVLYVTHDRELAARAHRVVSIRDGVVVAA